MRQISLKQFQCIVCRALWRSVALEFVRWLSPTKGKRCVPLIFTMHGKILCVFFATLWPIHDVPMTELKLSTSRPREAHAVDKRSPYSTPYPCGDWQLLYCLPSMGGQGYKRNQVSYTDHANWHGNVILMKFSSLVAMNIVQMTTFSADSDENFVKMTFPFQRWGIPFWNDCYEW